MTKSVQVFIALTFLFFTALSATSDGFSISTSSESLWYFQFPRGWALQVAYETNEMGSPARYVNDSGTSDIILSCKQQENNVTFQARIARGSPGYGATPVLEASPLVKGVVADLERQRLDLVTASRNQQNTTYELYRYRVPELALLTCSELVAPQPECSRIQGVGAARGDQLLIVWESDDKARQLLAVYAIDGNVVDVATVDGKAIKLSDTPTDMPISVDGRPCTLPEILDGIR